MGGPIGAVIRGGAGAAVTAGEMAYDGAVWYTNELSRVLLILTTMLPPGSVVK